MPKAALEKVHRICQTGSSGVGMGISVGVGVGVRVGVGVGVPGGGDLMKRVGLHHATLVNQAVRQILPK